MEIALDKQSAVIEHKSYARVGLLGNPSDVYFGNTISFSLGNFWASVRLEPSTDLVIVPHPSHDLVQFNSISHLVNRLQNEGYYGGVRLLMAICKIFHKYCKENNITLHDGNFTLSYDTNIPRQTGLSGSSAIVSAALSCLLDFYKVRHLIKVEVHSTVRQRWLEGDEFIRSTMEEVANIAVEGRKALLEKDYIKLVALMNHNFDLRRRMFGDDALGAMNIEMVEIARRIGAASKFTGSGGAVVVFCPDGPSQVKQLEDACHSAGFTFQPIKVMPSFLSEVDLQTLGSH